MSSTRKSTYSVDDPACDCDDNTESLTGVVLILIIVSILNYCVV